MNLNKLSYCLICLYTHNLYNYIFRLSMDNVHRVLAISSSPPPIKVYNFLSYITVYKYIQLKIIIQLFKYLHR